MGRIYLSPDATACMLEPATAETSVLKDEDPGKNMRVMTKPFQMEKLAELVRDMTGAF